MLFKNMILFVSVIYVIASAYLLAYVLCTSKILNELLAGDNERKFSQQESSLQSLLFLFL